VKEKSNLEQIKLVPDVFESHEIRQIKPEEDDKERGQLKKVKINKKLLIKVGLVALLFFVILILFVILPFMSLYKKAQFLTTLEGRFKSAVNSQDIKIISGEVAKTKEELISFRSSFNYFAWTSVLPVVGHYFRDGERLINAAFYGIEASEITLDTVEPYADIIGFKSNGKEATSGEETAQDRMEFVIETLDAIIPKLSEITDKVEKVKSELEEIDTSNYPEKIGNFDIRANFKKVLDIVDEAAVFVLETKPVIEKAHYLLGIDKERTYLVLFQNDKELRPTGGFITAYTIMKVGRGKVNPVTSEDIYKLDNRYTPSIPAPSQFIEFLKGPYVLSGNLRLRDMNYLADFKESMDLFNEEASKAGIKNIDGIIAVDTHTLVNILDVIGEIGVTGFGNYSTKIDPECQCPQVVHELEKFADVEGPIVWSENEPGKIVYRPPNSENRKGIIGPLMNSILANAMGQPKDKIPGLFEAIYKSLKEKHVLFYMTQGDVQEALEEANLAGRIEDYSLDYLHINDSNLGGRKSNLYTTQEVNQIVEIEKDGSLINTLTITYTNPVDYDGWLNSILPNWTRIYVPKGSEFVSFEGFEKIYDTYVEHGKTVFSGSFRLRPKGVIKVVVKYKVPIKIDGNYKVFIQKQPGTDKPFYSIGLKNRTEEFFLNTDTVVEIIN